jgi:hypothetical protein
VRENLRRENRNVVAGIGFSSDVEVLLGILRKLLEEQSKQGVNVLSSSDSVADSTAAVRVANVDGLVQEDNGSVGVPRIWVVDRLDVLINTAGPELHEESSERRTARSTIQPQNNRIVFGVVS